MVNFDEAPAMKESKPVQNQNKIDFFGVEDNDNDFDQINDFDQLEKDFSEDDNANNNPFGQSITKEVL